MGSRLEMMNSDAGTDVARRQRWMGILAKADETDLSALWTLAMPDGDPSHTPIRAPEVGMIMTRGRAGGGGQPFNLGEMTVTRCAVRLEASGTVGQAWVAGRSSRHALLAALCDGLLQDPESHDDLWRDIIQPLESAQDARTRRQARKAAATKVDFFTMVRGED